MLNTFNIFRNTNIIILFSSKYKDFDSLVENDYQYYFNEEKKKYENLQKVFDIQNQAVSFLGKVNFSLSNMLYPSICQFNILNYINQTLQYFIGFPRDVNNAQLFFDSMINEHKRITGLDEPPNQKIMSELNQNDGFDQLFLQQDALIRNAHANSLSPEEILNQAADLQKKYLSLFEEQCTNMMQNARQLLVQNVDNNNNNNQNTDEEDYESYYEYDFEKDDNERT